MTLPKWTNEPSLTPLSLKQIQDEFGCEPIKFAAFIPPPLPGPAVTSSTTAGIIIGPPTTAGATTSGPVVLPNPFDGYNETLATTPGGTLSGGVYTVTITAKTTLEIRLANGVPNTTVDWKSSRSSDNYTLGPANRQPSGGYVIKEFFETTGTYVFRATFTPTQHTRVLNVIVIAEAVDDPRPLTVTPVTNPIESYQPVQVSITGHPGDTIRWFYIDPDIDDLYFDHYPDVAASYALNNQSKSKRTFGDDHFTQFGNGEGRKNYADLQKLPRPVDGEVKLSAAGTATVDISAGKGYLGRSTLYSWNFVGYKSSGVKLVNFTIRPTYYIQVRGATTAKLNNTVTLAISGPPGDTVTYTRLDNNVANTITLDSTGAGTLNVTWLTSVQTYDIKFKGIKSSNTVYHGITVRNYVIAVSPTSTVVETGDVGTQKALVTVTGAPGETVTYVCSSLAVNNRGTFKLDSANGTAEGDIINGSYLAPGTYVWNLTGSISTNTVTYTLVVVKYNEIIGPGTSPYNNPIHQTIRITVSGGKPNTGLYYSWTGPNGITGSSDAVGPGLSGRYAIKLDSSGNYTALDARYGVAGTYTYKFEFEGSGNTRQYVVNVTSQLFTVEHKNYTINQYLSAYHWDQPIRVTIKSNPGDRIKVGRPTYPTLKETYEELGDSAVIKRESVIYYEGQLESLIDTSYYGKNLNGFPERTIVSTGDDLVDINGSVAAGIPFITQFNKAVKGYKDARDLEGQPIKTVDFVEFIPYEFSFTNLTTSRVITQTIYIYKYVDRTYYDVSSDSGGGLSSDGSAPGDGPSE